jgi:hypothetical protein
VMPCALGGPHRRAGLCEVPCRWNPGHAWSPVASLRITPHSASSAACGAPHNAEFEANLRRERQLEGIAAAKARGVYKGRKPIIKAYARLAAGRTRR